MLESLSAWTERQFGRHRADGIFRELRRMSGRMRYVAAV